MNKASRTRLIPLVSIFACLFCGAANARAADGEWTYSVTPYLWLAGISGTVDGFALLPPAEVDVGFLDDILGNINFAAMFAVEARKDRYGLFVDLAYVDVEEGATLRGVIYDSVNLQAKLWLSKIAGEVRLVESEGGHLDLLAGLQYMSWENSLKFSGDRSRDATGKDDWFDPLIGVKGARGIGDSAWFVNGFLMLGGFGVASDMTWDANLNLGYQWTGTFSTTVGYRYFDVDYEDDGFAVDVAMDGLVIGFNWAW
jgi:hypothetical protein